MDTIKIPENNVKMVAHRGVSGLETENTNAAFVAAGNRSYFGIECDVHVTADGRFVVIHDDNTERVCGKNYVVEETDYDTLKKLRLYDMRLGAKRSELMRSDCVIPDLEDYISICKKYDKKAVLELKKSMSREHVFEIVECIKKMGYLGGTVFISFSWKNLVYVRECFSEAEVQFLVTEYDDVLIKRLIDNRFDLDIHYAAVDEKLVSEIHSNGLKINCWTVDKPEDAKRVVALGVDFITSNILE